MIIVVLVNAHREEADARAAMAAEHGHGDLPYMGVWVHPTLDRPLVHIFSTLTADELEDAGWSREFDDPPGIGDLRVTAEKLRIELATALIRCGAGEDEGALFEWHPCVDTPACRAAADPKAPCPCSGVPYLSDKAWAELAPIVRRIQQGAARFWDDE